MPNTYKTLQQLFGQRFNKECFAVLPSAARTTSTSSATFTNNGAAGIIFYVNVTAVSGSPSLTPRLSVFNFNTTPGVTNPVADTALTGTGLLVYRIFPGAAGTNTDTFMMPSTWQFNMLHGTTDSCTYSVAAEYVYF